MDSRFRDSAQTITTYLLALTRKRKVHFIHIEPKRKWADIRARDLTDRAILCEKWDKETNKICYDDECIIPHKFHYDLIDLNSGKVRSFWIINPESIYPIYNTEQVIPVADNITEGEIVRSLNK